jgi:3-hydroxyisobutyrate dehydrogenase-like beta-hydroxyacid dehydrogenase
VRKDGDAMKYLTAALVGLCLRAAAYAPALAKSSGASHHSIRPHSSGKSSSSKVIVKKCKTQACLNKHPDGTVIIRKKQK